MERLTQGASGTAIGRMLNNPFKVLTPQMDNAIDRRDGIVFQYSWLVPRLPNAYRLVLRVESNPTTLYRPYPSTLPDARPPRVIHSGMTEGALQAMIAGCLSYRRCPLHPTTEFNLSRAGLLRDRRITLPS